jgi:hypothetical protein
MAGTHTAMPHAAVAKSAMTHATMHPHATMHSAAAAEGIGRSGKPDDAERRCYRRRCRSLSQSGHRSNSCRKLSLIETTRRATPSLQRAALRIGDVGHGQYFPVLPEFVFLPLCGFAPILQRVRSEIIPR